MKTKRKTKGKGIHGRSNRIKKLIKKEHIIWKEIEKEINKK